MKSLILTAKLKTCPFCRGEAYFGEMQDADGDPIPSCQRCGATPLRVPVKGRYVRLSDYIRAWNHRAKDGEG